MKNTTVRDVAAKDNDPGDEQPAETASITDSVKEEGGEEENSDVKHWKDLAKLWEKRAKDNLKDAENAKAALNEREKGDKEAAAEAIDDLKKKLEAGTLETSRLSAALEWGISKEDADIFLTGSTVEEINTQAQRLSEKIAHQKYSPEDSLPTRKQSKPSNTGNLKNGFDAWERRNKK